MEDDDDQERRLQAPRARADGPHRASPTRRPARSCCRDDAARHQRRQHGRGLAAAVDALPWRDALHEGPVVTDGRTRRAEFLGVDEARVRGARRMLDAHEGDYVLWFEADLYDQLQIAEILAPAARVDPARIRCARSASTSGSRTSAASASCARAAAGAPRGRSSRADALALGVRAWEALTAPEPHRPARGRQHARVALHGRGVQAPRAGVPVAPRRALAVRAAPAGGHAGHEVRAVRARLAQGAAPVPGRHVRVRALERLAPLLARRRTASCASTTRRARARGRGAVRDRALDRRRPRHADTPWRWDDAREAIT